MPWWQSPFSNKSTSDDSLLGGRYNNFKPSVFSRRTNRLLAAAKKVRQNNFGEHGFEHPSGPKSTTPTSGNSVLPEPHPLPLPELQCLSRSNYTNVISSSTKSGNVPPPRSPDDNAVGPPQPDKGRGRDHNKVLDARYGRFSCDEDGRTETFSGRLAGRDFIGFNVPLSAPTSPFASPRTSSPLRGRVSHDGGYSVGDGDGKDIFNSQYVTMPGCFQVWSAPEMFSSSYGDSSNFGNISLNHYVYSENEEHASDGSPPIRSPLISPLPPSYSSHSHRPSYSQCLSPSLPNVHPLPLPPPTSSHSQQHPHLSPIHEIVPVNSQWQKGKLLGRGTFGSVYVASNRETGALCAMKEVEMLPDDPKSAESIKQLEQEIKVLSHLKHPNIVQYYGSEIVGDRFFIYLEYVHPGSLTRFIKDHCGGITEAVVRNFTRHILCGLAYLHSTKTIHRDIKGANLLVDAYGVVKLADFGMAKHLHGHKANLSLKGSPYWMAPELLQSVMHTDTNSEDALAVDIWSLGCTVIEMLTGTPPWSEYEGAAAMFKVLQENPPFPEDLSQDGRDFLSCCFRRNPAERPTAAMLLEHKFVRGNHQAPDAPSYSTKRPSVLNDSLLSRRGHQVPMVSDTQIMQGKPAEQHNEMSLRGTKEGANIWDASPRSTLESLPSLSPPNSGHDYIGSPFQKSDRTTKKP